MLISLCVLGVVQVVQVLLNKLFHMCVVLWRYFLISPGPPGPRQKKTAFRPVKHYVFVGPGNTESRLDHLDHLDLFDGQSIRLIPIISRLRSVPFRSPLCSFTPLNTLRTSLKNALRVSGFSLDCLKNSK